MEKVKLPLLLSFCLFFSLQLLAQPVISSFTPVSGTPGTSLTISGSNFNSTAANNIVYFGAARATVNESSTTQLTVTVPPGATYSQISVFNTATSLSGYSNMFFIPQSSPYKDNIDMITGNTLATGLQPSCTAVGDLDGDGKADLVVVNNGSGANTISLLRNNSSAGSLTGSSFETAIAFTLGTTPRHAAIADFNGDGKPDIAVANSGANTVSILINNISAAGSFTTNSFAVQSATLRTGSNPQYIAAGDFDGDGKIDLVTSNNSAATLSVFRNTTSTGTVSFAGATSISVSSSPCQAIVGDLDKNGKPDIVVAYNGSGNNISIVRNTNTVAGTLSFASAFSMTAVTTPRSVALGDLDNDGNLDIATGNVTDNSICLFRNIYTSGTISSTSFTKSTISSISLPRSIVIGDVNGDGKPDIAISNSSSTNTVSILRNIGTGDLDASSFASPAAFAVGTNPQHTAVADLDGDGRADIITTNNGINTLSILRNRSVTSSLSALTLSAGSISSFSPATTAYEVSVPSTVSSITLTPVKTEINSSIQVRINSGSYVTVASGSASGSLSLNTGSNTVDIKVTAQDGVSITTYTITVTRLAAQTISFAALGSKTFGDIDFSPGAVASSSLSISYSSNNTSVATIADGKIHIVGAGSTIITASQAGDAAYEAATAVNQILTVNKASQAITFPALSPVTYGDADIDPAGIAGSGLAISYSSDNTAVATVVSGKIQVVGAGTATITASQPGNTNYNAATSVDQALTVNKMSQSVTFNTLGAKTYGEADFDPAGVSSAGLIVTYSSNNTSVATIVEGKIHITGVGSAVITASQPGDGNHIAATAVDQTLTVSKAPQTITFNPLPSKVYGDSDFDPAGVSSLGLAITYTSDNANVATIVSGKIHIVGAGTATITASQNGGDNFNAASPVNQSLTVNKATQSITFGTLPIKFYGDPDFAPGATSSSGLTVVYSSSNTTAATIVDGNIHLGTPGTTTITASQPGNANYNAAVSVDQVLTVKKSLQTITFNALPSKSYGDADFSPGATASSGLTISYSSSNTNVATIVSGKIHIVGPGTATITAAQSGNSRYFGAASVVQTLTVSKASQTISFNTIPDKTYGNADFSPGGTTSSGLVLSYSSGNTNVATVADGNIHIVGAGTTTITANQAGDANYNAASSVTQTLIVNKASQTITFGAFASKTYGDSDFDPSAISSSGLAVHYSSDNLSVATIVDGKIHIAAPGTATITASQSGDANYTAAPSANQVLTVSKASQTITFAALSARTYGDDDFDPAARSSSGLAVTYTSSNTSVATIVSGKIHLVGAGTATITASQSGDVNYTPATSVNQILTVDKSPQTISFGVLSARTYGDGDFDPAATSSSGLAVTYTSSNTSVATIVSGKIHMVGAGTATITASQSGDGNYTPATSVNQILTVDKSPQTISFGVLSARTYGDGDFDPAAASSSGLTVTYTSSNTSVATIVSGKIHLVGAGTTTISASQSGDDNYAAASSIDQTLIVNKVSQTISFTTLAAKTYGDSDFDPSAISSSGLTVSYSSGNAAVATIISGQIHITGAGTTTITASQSGDGNHIAAPSASQNLTVNKASQTITFGTVADKTYGDSDFDPVATATSGLIVTYSSDNASVASIVDGKVHIVGAGTAVITASQSGDENYDPATPVDQLITINKASQAVTFAPIAARTYNDADFDPGASSSSGLNVNYSSDNASVAVIESGKVHIMGSGTAFITASQEGDHNYSEASPVTQQLIVVKANQQITFAAIEPKNYGDGDFDLLATTTSGLSIGYVSGNEDVATIINNRVHIVAAGSTVITASQSGSANYNAAVSVSQILTVINPVSSNANLSGLATSHGVVKPDFSSGITEYEMSVSDSVASMNIIPAAEDSSATVTVNGIPVSSAHSSQAVALKVGNNIITTVVTAQDAITTKTYTLKVRRLPSAIATLSEMKISSGVLSPSFASSITSYSVSVNNSVSAIKITPVSESTAAGITINGISHANGTISEDINLRTGDNVISIVITAQDMTTIKTYTITVKRALSSVADLSRLVLSKGTLYPEFDPELTSYTTVVNNSVASIELTPVTKDEKTIVGVNGLFSANQATHTIALEPGKNTVVTRVTAEDGTTSKTYTLTVIRAESDQKVPDAGGNVTLDNASNEVLVVSPVQPVVVSVPASISNPTIDYGLLISEGTGTLPKTVVNSPVASYVIPESTVVKSSGTGWNGVISAPVVSTYDLPPVAGEIITTGLVIEVGSTEHSLSFSRGVRLLFPGQAGMRAAYVHGGVYSEITSTGSSDTQSAGDALPEGGTFKINAGTDLVIWTKVFSRFITFSQTTDLNAAIVAADKDALTIDMIKGLNADAENITMPLVSPLPARGEGGSDITWASADPGIISNDGQTINRPLLGSGNVTLTLTATIRKGLITDTKSFILTVKEQANQAPGLAPIDNQIICYTTDQQTISISGITPGAETYQSTILSVSSSNPNLLSSLTILPDNGVATLRYSVRTGVTGATIVTVTVKDNGGTANGGIDTFTRIFSIVVNPLPTIVISSSSGTSISKGTVTNLTASGGVTYRWATGNGIISGLNTATLTVRPSETTTYTVTATNSSGCSISYSITVNVLEDYKLDAANILTPNGDERNDTFVINNLDMYPDHVLKIFDRSGRLVYTKKGYANDWDGTYNGLPLAEDTYYYVLDFGAGKGRLKGFVSIIR